MGTCIGLLSIVDQTRRLTFRNKRTRADLVSSQSSPSWPEITRDVFLSVNGLLSVTTHSRKPKARHITAWLVRDVVWVNNDAVNEDVVGNDDDDYKAGGERLTFRNKRTRADLVSSQSSPSWPEITRDVFLSVNGLLSVTTHSRKPKARHITAWLVRDVVWVNNDAVNEDVVGNNLSDTLPTCRQSTRKASVSEGWFPTRIARQSHSTAG